MTFAPIALFVYRRPEHTRRTITSLQACPEFDQSPMIVYSDGPRDAAAEPGVAATRAVVHDMLPHARIIEAPANRGLAASIIAGVDALTAEFGKVIVVEDDLIVARDFLTFLNAALDRYADEERVMQISGHMFGVDVGPDAVLLPFISTWGWATWARAWAHFDSQSVGATESLADASVRRRFNLDHSYDYYAMLKRQMNGSIDSWGIRWYWSVFKRNGLVCYPPESRVLNEGFDDGTHGGKSASQTVFAGTASPRAACGKFPVTIGTDEAALARIVSVFRSSHSRNARIRRRIASFFA